jgi:DNA-binding transcriptional regulator YhcF (GntR family)
VSGTTLDRLPLELSDASGVPFYRQIVDQLAELIRSGRLAPEARLPSVRDL